MIAERFGRETGTWSSLLTTRVSATVPGTSLSDQEKKEQNMAELIDSVLDVFILADPMGLKECSTFERTTLLIVSIGAHFPYVGEPP